MAKRNNDLVKWTKEGLKRAVIIKDDGSKIESPSARQWSLAGDKGGHAVTDIIERGRASPDMIADLARAGQLNVIEALLVQGILHPDDILDLEGIADIMISREIGLSADQKELLANYKPLQPTAQRTPRDIMRELRRNAVGQESTAVEENTPQEA